VPETRIVKLTLQYDGTEYVGWQRQANGVSIQSLLEDALAPLEGAPVTVTGAGRTDAGVHALAQVASVPLTAPLDDETLQRALNAKLPGDVRVVGAERAADDFNARFAASGKTYEYRIVNGPFLSPFERRYAWHLPHPLNVGAMQAAADALVGTHDFAAFQAAGGSVKTTERDITSLEVDFDSPHLSIVVSANGFLRHMVRAIVGTLVEVGAGRATAAWVGEVLASRDRARAGPTAPALGLFLVSVDY
jgi:tRNA pseudouridine38-40 synthase